MATRPEDVAQTERVAWSELRPAFLERFEQGEHCATIGPTGQGKTTLAFDLLEGFHEHGGSVIVLANKNRDPVLSKLVAAGWPRIKSWPPHYEHRVARKVILWPNYGLASNARANRPIFVKALDGIMKEGKWFVYVDEMRYMIEQLGLRTIFDEYWNAARSNRVTLIAGSQGVSWIPRGMTTQESWLFLFRPRNAEERKDYATAAGEIEVREELRTLGNHEFLMVHTPSGERYISRVGT